MTFWELLFLIIIAILIYLLVEAGPIILIIVIVLLVAYYVWTNYIRPPYERFTPELLPRPIQPPLLVEQQQQQQQQQSIGQPRANSLGYDQGWYIPVHQYYQEKINYEQNSRPSQTSNSELNRWQTPSGEIEQLWDSIKDSPIPLDDRSTCSMTFTGLNLPSCSLPPSYVQTPEGILTVPPTISANCAAGRLTDDYIIS